MGEFLLEAGEDGYTGQINSVRFDLCAPQRDGSHKIQDRDEIGRNIYLAALARCSSLSTRGHYREKLDFDESEEQSGVEEETRKG